MYVYFTIFFLMFVLSTFSNGKDDKRIAFIITLFLIFFVGLRYRVGCDFGAYVNRYENTYPNINILEIARGNEALFELIMRSIVYFDMNFYWVNIICTIIIFISYFYFASFLQKPTIFMATMFPIVIIQLSMSGVRQAVAVSLVTAAMMTFTKGKRFTTGALTLAAASFHTSAALFLPLAFFAGREIRAGKLFFAFAIGLPIVFGLLSDRLGVYSDRYINEIYGEMSSGGAWIRYPLVLLPAVLFFLNKKKSYIYYPQYRGIFLIMSIYIASLSVLGLFSSLILHRMMYYAFPFSIFLFLGVIFLLFNKMQYRYAIYIPMIIHGSYMIFWFAMSRHASLCYVPYDNYLFH